jgi:uncharacterized protein (TIGR02246 family)
METPEHESRATDQTEVESDETQIRQLLEDVNEAIEARNIETILAAYAPDAEIFDVRDSLRYLSKDGLRKSWDECFQSSQDFSIKVRDLKVEVDQNLAFAHCLSHATGTANDGEKIDVWMRATQCFKKFGDKWLVIHDHISVPGDFTNGELLQDLKPESTLHQSEISNRH